MPTQQQLDNRLNPTPVTYATAGNGLYRAKNDFGSQVYYKDPSTGAVSSVSLIDAKNGFYNPTALGDRANAGDQASLALMGLKSQYGFDYSALPEFNTADPGNNSTGQLSADAFRNMLTKPVVAGPAGQTTVNGPATQADINAHLPQANVPGQTTQPTNTTPTSTTPYDAQTANQGPNAQANTPSGTDPNAPQNAQNAPVGASTAQAVQGGYMGPSVVDYLNSVGKPSDFATRAELAKQNGIANYTGTAAQNTQLLNTLRTTNAPLVTNPNTNASGLTTGVNSSGAATQSSTGGAADAYAGLDPIQRQVKMYTDAATALGLPTIKQQYDKTVKDQQDLTNEMNDKIADIRNNPWLSQGIADKEVQKLQDKYATRLDTLTHLETLYDSMYKQGQAQVENVVSGAQADIKAANELAQKQLDAAAALAKDNVVVTIGNNEVLVNKSTGKQVAVLGPSAASVKPAGGSGTSNQTIDNERALFNQFNGEPIVKDYNTILAKKLSVDKILSSKLGGPGDLAVVYEFMKGLDPTSVVRETEYDTAAKSGNIFAGAFAKFNGYLSPNGGFLPDSVKSSFQSIVNSKLQVQQQLYDNVAKQYQAIAGRQGLNPENVTVNYSAANTGNNSSSSSQSKFSDVQSSITFKDKTAYIPRSVWAGVSDKDGLLQEAKNDGYTLLIND